ncbi:MAG TPA: hypothetical protein VGJ07_09150 [Rugosimonospora sp.]
MRSTSSTVTACRTWRRAVSASSTWYTSAGASGPVRRQLVPTGWPPGFVNPAPEVTSRGPGMVPASCPARQRRMSSGARNRSATVVTPEARYARSLGPT